MGAPRPGRLAPPRIAVQTGGSVTCGPSGVRDVERTHDPSAWRDRPPPVRPGRRCRVRRGSRGSSVPGRGVNGGRDPDSAIAILGRASPPIPPKAPVPARGWGNRCLEQFSRRQIPARRFVTSATATCRRPASAHNQKKFRKLATVVSCSPCSQGPSLGWRPLANVRLDALVGVEKPNNETSFG